ncbi:hypothetical protein FNJ84_07425 [Paracoccus sp. M683]|uniref:hypothetical protein n=1 Tax=Paracoccus sp. M683 TaxID=2594268 RepID=UPI0011811807|nr:hypothetical protein [Paracoccus sp. M683]TRW97341.1 hypothetical protein FNJ84_07425 [Paracoccus sp. M683]
MTPALRQPVLIPAALIALLAGCGGNGEGLAERPRPKPDQMSVVVADPSRKQGESPMTLARISTKSGEILILEPDGSVSTMQLDSAAGRDVFRATEAQMAALRNGRDPIWNGVVAKGVRRKGPTAQELAMQEFAAQTGPALPEQQAAVTIDPGDFLGVTVAAISADRHSDLVEVSANLREGVDADIAFSYATCALAAWAKDKGTPYARHIRTVQDRRGGKLLIGAAYMLSDQRPLGLRVMETNDTLRECRDRGIPAA